MAKLRNGYDKDGLYKGEIRPYKGKKLSKVFLDSRQAGGTAHSERVNKNHAYTLGQGELLSGIIELSYKVAKEEELELPCTVWDVLKLKNYRDIYAKRFGGKGRFKRIN